MIAVAVPLLCPWYHSLPLAFLKAAVASKQNSLMHYWKGAMRSQGRVFLILLQSERNLKGKQQTMRIQAPLIAK